MTRSRHLLLILALWALSSLLLGLGFNQLGKQQVSAAVSEELRYHLLLALDESLFSIADNRINDQDAIRYVGEQINAALADFIQSRWYAPLSACEVHIQSLDHILVDDRPADREQVITLPRNQIDREVRVGVDCSPNWRLWAFAAALLGGLFTLIYLLFPRPLTAAHRRWINYLDTRGYESQQAFELVQPFDAQRLALSPAQMGLLEQLHRAEERNFAKVLALATDSRVAALAEGELAWLALGLAKFGDDSLDQALALARGEDLVEIDLEQGRLMIHGLPVGLGKTPLFYYAWYARARLEGDGWLTNPASNRPNQEEGQRLAELMWKFGGHGKAIADLEQTGLKARTLDQNRSKIKDELVAALGDELAGHYLFDAEKHPDGVRMRYRIHLPAAQIRLSD